MLSRARRPGARSAAARRRVPRRSATFPVRAISRGFDEQSWAWRSPQASPIGLAWTPGENDKLFLGGKLPAKRAAHPRRRHGRATSASACSRRSRRRKKTIKENNQDKVVDDLERTLRLEGDPVFPPIRRT